MAAAEAHKRVPHCWEEESMMKGSRVFRLARRAVTRWRRLLRACPDRYLRLDPTQSRRRCCNPLAMTKKLLDWGRRCLTRRSLRHETHADDSDGGAAPLLEPEAGSKPAPPPKGHLAVYVGGWEGGRGPPPRRYLVSLMHFNHPLFGELLREAEAEFGYHHPGGITIPCPVARFERVQTRIAAAYGPRRRIARSQCTFTAHHPS